jgi:hypothetical protein
MFIFLSDASFFLSYRLCATSFPNPLACFAWFRPITFFYFLFSSSLFARGSLYLPGLFLGVGDDTRCITLLSLELREFLTVATIYRLIKTF